MWPPNWISNSSIGGGLNSRNQTGVAGSCPCCTRFACSTLVLSKDSMPPYGLSFKHVWTTLPLYLHISFIHHVPMKKRKNGRLNDRIQPWSSPAQRLQRLSGSRSWYSPPTSLPWLDPSGEGIGDSAMLTPFFKPFECPKLQSSLRIWRFCWTCWKHKDLIETKLRFKVDECWWLYTWGCSNTMCWNHVHRQRGMWTSEYPQLYQDSGVQVLPVQLPLSLHPGS